MSRTGQLQTLKHLRNRDPERPVPARNRTLTAVDVAPTDTGQRLIAVDLRRLSVTLTCAIALFSQTSPLNLSIAYVGADTIAFRFECPKILPVWFRLVRLRKERQTCSTGCVLYYPISLITDMRSYSSSCS